MLKEVKQKLKLVQQGNKAGLVLDCQQEFAEGKQQNESEGEPEDVGQQLKKAKMQIRAQKGKKVKTNNFIE